ncbi:MAG: F0F1 ATP synthase subunit B [Bacillota bacterium]|nr:F0F1 ATP synthase subunit B [Bacillota bacterium]
MEINRLTVLMTILNFALLVWVLNHFLFKKVQLVINNRENEIAGRIKKTETDEMMAENLRIQNEQKLLEAKEQGKGIVEESKKKAEMVSGEIIQEAKNEADVLMDRARKEAEREKEKAAEEIKSQAVELAILLSQKALEKTIDENEHRRLINDFIYKVGI